MTNKVKASEGTAEKIEQLIYMGPDLSGGRLAKYKVFLGGIPDFLSDVVGENPDITLLIVPVAKLNETLKLIASVGTPQQMAYEKLKGV